MLVNKRRGFVFQTQGHVVNIIQSSASIFLSMKTNILFSWRLGTRPSHILPLWVKVEYLDLLE